MSMRGPSKLRHKFSFVFVLIGMARAAMGREHLPFLYLWTMDGLAGVRGVEWHS
jgi:hypothetical protein